MKTLLRALYHRIKRTLGEEKAKDFYKANLVQLRNEQNALYAEHRENYKERNRLCGRRRKGIKEPTGETKFGTCVICLEENVQLVCDHNHETGEIRGWPCNKCNMTMGRWKDDIKILERALKYLKGGN